MPDPTADERRYRITCPTHGILYEGEMRRSEAVMTATSHDAAHHPKRKVKRTKIQEMEPA